MPLTTETTTIDEAIEALEEQREALADQLAQIPPAERTPDNDEVVQIQAEASEVERHLGGLEWACEQYGGDAVFELAGLTTSEIAHVNDRTNDFRQTTITPTQSVEGAASVFWIAEGVREAPFFDGVDEADDPFERKVAAIRGLPKQLTDWLEAEINDLSTVGEREGNSFDALVAAKSETYHPDSN
ncbi:hypothetical protein [Salinilacihabitans rarus]|uniref:hypothetical protein n=1 Tax=Salinilacihabitans rarus TaxID=2961596 RepID=UPI0020C9051F|nr:hypothetical protein [Salinilacihabitans rarus]